MATRTIAVAGGNWNTAATWVEVAVPTSADDVVATAVSGNLTIDAASACRSIDLTGYVGTLTHNAGFTLSVGDASGGALKFVAGMTYTLGNANTSKTAFVSTSNNGGTGWAITTAGKTFGDFQFNGAGGKWVLQDAVNISNSALALTAGTLDTNSQTVTGGNINAANSNVRTLTMGSSAINLSGGGNACDIVSTNLTITTNTATMTFTNGFFRCQTASTNLNGLSIVHTGTGSQTLDASGCTFANVTWTGGASATNTFTIANNFTVTGTFTVSGNSVAPNRLLVTSNTTGTARTITCNGTVTASNVDFMDITGAGSASWNLSAISGGAGDCLGNSGITFTTPVTRYGVVAGNWSATATWSSTSGGAGGSTAPLPQDTAILDASSAAGNYVINMARPCKDLTCTGFTRTLQNQTTAISFFGSITFASGMTWTQNQFVYLRGRGSHTVTSAGKIWAARWEIYAVGGTYTLQDDQSWSGTANSELMLHAGTLDINSKTISIPAFLGSFGTQITASLILGTGTINLYDTATTGGQGFGMWDVAGTTTLSVASGTIAISAASANSRTFHGQGRTYGTLTYTVASSTGALVVNGSNTFNTINVSGGTRTLTLQNGTTTTVTNWNVAGVDGSNLVSLISSSAGSTTTQLTKAGGGTVSSAYLSVKDSKATPASTWYADPGGVDAGNNTGWTFGPPGVTFIAAPEKPSTFVPRVRASVM